MPKYSTNVYDTGNKTIMLSTFYMEEILFYYALLTYHFFLWSFYIILIFIYYFHYYCLNCLKVLPLLFCLDHHPPFLASQTPVTLQLFILYLA